MWRLSLLELPGLAEAVQHRNSCVPERVPLLSLMRPRSCSAIHVDLGRQGSSRSQSMGSCSSKGSIRSSFEYDADGLSSGARSPSDGVHKMRVRLDRNQVVRLYCYTFQGDRSVAFGLGAPWSELRDYYGGDRLSGLLRLLHDLREWSPSPDQLALEPLRSQVFGKHRPPGLFRVLFGKWLAPWRKTWTFTTRELTYMAAVLGELVRLLEQGQKPDLAKMYELRQELCACRSLIEDRCFGMPEIKRARWLEHFWQAPWVTPVRLQEVVTELPHSDPETRRSA